MSQPARTDMWQNSQQNYMLWIFSSHQFITPVCSWFPQAGSHTDNTWTLVSQVLQSSQNTASLLPSCSLPVGWQQELTHLILGRTQPRVLGCTGRGKESVHPPLQLSSSGAWQEGAQWQLGDIPGQASPWAPVHSRLWMHSQPLHPTWGCLILYQQPLGTSDFAAACQAGTRWDTQIYCTAPPTIPRNTAAEQGRGILECRSEGCLSPSHLIQCCSLVYLLIVRSVSNWFLRYPNRKPEGALCEDRYSRIHHPAEAAAHSVTCSTHSFSQSMSTSLPQGSDVQGKRERRLWKMTGVRGAQFTAKGLLQLHFSKTLKKNHRVQSQSWVT